MAKPEAAQAAQVADTADDIIGRILTIIAAFLAAHFNGEKSTAKAVAHIWKRGSETRNTHVTHLAVLSQAVKSSADFLWALYKAPAVKGLFPYVELLTAICQVPQKVIWQALDAAAKMDGKPLHGVIVSRSSGGFLPTVCAVKYLEALSSDLTADEMKAVKKPLCGVALFLAENATVGGSATGSSARSAAREAAKAVTIDALVALTSEAEATAETPLK